MKLTVDDLRARVDRYATHFGPGVPRPSEPTELVSAILVLALSIPLALVVGVPTMGVGLGLVLGLLAGSALYWSGSRIAAIRLKRRLVEAGLEADRRVQLVTRQYEWAVNDVANLKDALRNAQADRTELETSAQLRRDHIDKLERAMSAFETGAAAPTAGLTLRSRVYEDRSLWWLRLESIDRAPSQVRVRGRQGGIVAISTRILEPVTTGPTAFVLRIPDDVAAAIRHHNTLLFAAEALIDEKWVGADLLIEATATQDTAIREAAPAGVTPTAVVDAPAVMRDKRGRVYRTETTQGDEHAPGESLTTHRP
jgi:hypothetical protein